MNDPYQTDDPIALDRHIRSEIRRFAAINPYGAVRDGSVDGVAALLSDAKMLILALAQELDYERECREAPPPSMAEEFMGVLRQSRAGRKERKESEEAE